MGLISADQKEEDYADGSKGSAKLAKYMIVIVLAAAGILACGPLGDTILQFAFMSMGLRGAVVFVPLTCALWLPGRIPRKFILAAVIAGPLMVLLFGLWNVLPFDPLFAGVLAAILIAAMGFFNQNKQVSVR